MDTDFAITTATREGRTVLTVHATIVDDEGFARFCASLNPAAAALWPEPIAPEPEKKPRKKNRPIRQGEPNAGTTDAVILAWAREHCAKGFDWPKADVVADAFDLQTGIAAMSIGRLKKRGVWGVA